MSIASRISAIEEHLTDDYSVLELAGADLTNVDKNIINLKPTWQERLLYFMNNGTDVVWNNWDKVIGEGESLSLNNTLEAKMKIDLKGNTYQYSTTGKNKMTLPNQNETTHQYGITYKVENNVFTLSGTNTSTSNYGLVSWSDTTTRNYFNSLFQKGKTFTLSVNNNVTGLYFQINYYKEGATSQSSMTSLDNFANASTFTIPQDFDSIGVIFLGVLGTATTINGSFSLQLEEGDQKTSFEPYTNGASPNPSYPQDIQVVSGDNTIKVEGKNLFDKSKEINSTFTTSIATALQNYKDTGKYAKGYIVYSSAAINADNRFQTIFIKCQENTTYTISSVAELNPSSICYLDNEGNIVGAGKNYWSTFYTFTFTTTQNSQYIAIGIFTTSIDTIQIEKRSSSSTYAPYVSQSYPINLGNIELCKIGTYQDKIAKSTGKNLFDKNSMTWVRNNNDNPTDTSNTNVSRIRTQTLMKLEGGKTYTISGIPNGVQSTPYVKFYASSTSTTKTSGENGSTFTVPSNAPYVIFQFNGENFTDATNLLMKNANIQLEQNNQATSYEPYGTSWYLEKKIGKKVYKGEESEQWGPYTTHVFRSQPITKIRNCLSNLYIFNSTEFMGQLSNGQFGIANASNQYALCVRDDRFDTATELKEWLNTHYLSIYYPLNTPTYETITDTTLLTQLNALGNANSYNNQTNINQDNNDLASILSATALEEM